jgi:hypothetical protein
MDGIDDNVTDFFCVCHSVQGILWIPPFVNVTPAAIATSNAIGELHSEVPSSTFSLAIVCDSLEALR